MLSLFSRVGPALHQDCVDAGGMASPYYRPIFMRHTSPVSEGKPWYSAYLADAGIQFWETCVATTAEPLHSSTPLFHGPRRPKAPELLELLGGLVGFGTPGVVFLHLPQDRLGTGEVL